MRLTLSRNTTHGSSDFRQVRKLPSRLHVADSCLAPRKACWTVPFARNPRFVGRESQLQRLESILFAEGEPSKLAITGLGGVGIRIAEPATGSHNHSGNDSTLQGDVDAHIPSMIEDDRTDAEEPSGTELLENTSASPAPVDPDVSSIS